MESQPSGNGDVQYIATQEFIRTLLSGMNSLPGDLLDLLDEHYQLLADPGVDEPGYTGIGHRSEQAFLWEYRQNRRSVKSDARRLEMRHPDARLHNGPVPFHLIAMALRHSPEGKRRVVLTDDPGLIEWLQFFGVETMESADFIRKLVHDRVIAGNPAPAIYPGAAGNTLAESGSTLCDF